MAFGQHAGPPATARQMRELMELVSAAGHRDLRDARGPLGLTQRQAAGKFTRDEAESLIEQLQADSGDTPSPSPAPSTAPAATAGQRTPRPATRAEQTLRTIPSEMLAAELQRRGWVVLEP